MTTTTPVLDVRGLTVTSGSNLLVQDVSLQIDPGECVALVGSSGSGKTLTARAILRLSAPGLAVDADQIRIDGEPVHDLPQRDWRRFLGRTIGYVGQEALGSLDPLRPIGREVGDALRLHTGLTAYEQRDAVRRALSGVGLDPAMATDRRRAGELSGGMRQRALIAAATIARPRLVIADEPTTALDAYAALAVMETLQSAREHGAAVLVITHDLGLVQGWADRVLVMTEGRIVEQGPPDRVLTKPEHPTTRALVQAAMSGRLTPQSLPATRDDDRVLLEARGLARRFGTERAVDDVDLTVTAGRTLGIVGPSGSGKTTLVRMLLGLEPPDGGTVVFDDAPWVPLREHERRARRPRIAAVTQDPGATFDSAWTVERVLADALTGGRERRANGSTSASVDAALRSVDLDPALRPRSPLTLSGGQRQRLAIARALATEPEVLVLDEPVTALDATVQDAVLTLLERLRDTTGVAMVFVSHDLRAVRRIADDLIVMHAGSIVERGMAWEVLAHPSHPVTGDLLRSAEQLIAGPMARR